MSEQPWQRLSRRALLLEAMGVTELVPLLLAAIVFTGAPTALLLPPLLAGVVLVAVGRWMTTTYRITPERIELRRGLVSRSTLSVPRDRVRTVDLTANFTHRVLELERVTIGTGAAKADDNLVLDGVRIAHAAALRATLLHRPDLVRVDPAPADLPRLPQEHAPPPLVEEELSVLQTSWVRFAPFSLSGLVTLGAIGAVLSHGFGAVNLNPGDWAAVRDAERSVADAQLASVALAAGLVLIGLVVFSSITYVLLYAEYRLTREGSALHVRRGLFTTRAVSIEQRRLHGVTLRDPLPLRLARGGSLSAITTGLVADDGADESNAMLTPPAPIAEVRRVAMLVTGDEDAVLGALDQHGPAARRRRWTRTLVPAGVLVAGLVVLAALDEVPARDSGVPALALLVLAALLAADRYRNLGSAVIGGRLVVRRGSIVRSRDIVAGEGVIGWVSRATYFQRRAGLVTLTAATAAGTQGYAAPDLPADRALALISATTPGLLDPFLGDSPPAR